MLEYNMIICICYFIGVETVKYHVIYILKIHILCEVQKKKKKSIFPRLFYGTFIIYISSVLWLDSTYSKIIGGLCMLNPRRDPVILLRFKLFCVHHNKHFVYN